jgi:hypothetical protein
MLNLLAEIVKPPPKLTGGVISTGVDYWNGRFEFSCIPPLPNARHRRRYSFAVLRAFVALLAMTTSKAALINSVVSGDTHAGGVRTRPLIRAAACGPLGPVTASYSH